MLHNKFVALLTGMAFWLAPCGLRAQYFSNIPLATRPQLPVAQVHAVVRDGEGYAWYATSGGLCRDNGYQVDVFRMRQNDGGVMRSNNIVCLATMGGRYLLFGTDKGLYRIDKTSYQVSEVSLPRGAGPRIDALLVTGDGTLWVAAGKMVVRMDGRRGKQTAYPSAMVTARLYEDRAGAVWQMCWKGGLRRIMPHENHFKTMPWSVEGWPSGMVDMGRGRYLVSTYGRGVVDYDARTGMATECLATLGDDADGNDVISMVYDERMALLWTTTMNDLRGYRVAGRKLMPLETGAFLPPGKKILDQLMIDCYGQLWVPGFTPATFVLVPGMGGMRRMTVPEMRIATGYPPLLDRMVEDGEGYYWIWQGRRGLALYHEGRQPLFIHEGGGTMPAHVERTLRRCASRPGIWATEGSRLYHLWHDGMKMGAELVADLRAGRIMAVAEDNGGNLYMSTTKGMWRVNPATKRVYRLLSANDLAENMLVVGNGTGYALTTDGQLWTTGPTGRAVKVRPGGHRLTALAMAPDGTLWVGTGTGEVWTVDERGARREGYACNDEEQGIRQLCFDGIGHLWALTDQTVSEYNPENRARIVHRASDRHIDVDYFYCLEPRNATEMGVAGAGAYCVLPSTREIDMRRGQGGVVRVSAVEAQGRGVTLVGMGCEQFDVGPESQALSVRLTTGDLPYAPGISFAYRIDEDGTWVRLPQGVNTVNIAKLRRGKHRLFVRATDRHGRWGEPQQCIVLRRLPAWYETWWAWLIYAVTGIMGVVGIVTLNRKIRYLGRMQRLQRVLSLRKVDLKQEDIKSERYDSEFARKLIRTVEDHIGDPLYNVERLSDDMAMSRMSLYRKVKELTGKSPVDLIREIRLKHAAQLLLENRHASVADIATKVGFATPSYFAKCFKAMFGVLPNRYREMKSENREEADE